MMMAFSTKSNAGIKSTSVGVLTRMVTRCHTPELALGNLIVKNVSANIEYHQTTHKVFHRSILEYHNVIQVLPQLSFCQIATEIPLLWVICKVRRKDTHRFNEDTFKVSIYDSYTNRAHKAASFQRKTLNEVNLQ